MTVGNPPDQSYREAMFELIDRETTTNVPELAMAKDALALTANWIVRRALSQDRPFDYVTGVSDEARLALAVEMVHQVVAAYEPWEQTNAEDRRWLGRLANGMTEIRHSVDHYLNQAQAHKDYDALREVSLLRRMGFL